MSRALPSMVIDCDPGIDDGIALALAAASVTAGEVELAAVTTVAGNVGVECTSRNARLVLDRVGLADVPVLVGADRPLGRSLPADAVAFHGDDGLAGLYEPDHGPVAEGGALAEVLGRGGATRARRLVALGPLTNLALALRHDPTVLDALDRVVVMGGGFGDPAGNVTEHAEFNFYADPVAADEVLGALGDRLTVVPLDVTRRVLMDESDSASVRAARGDDLISALLAAGIVGQRRVSDLLAMAAHDPLALAVALDPGLVDCVPHCVRVVADDALRGACRLEPTGEPASRPPVRVALDVDVERAHSAVLDPLCAPRP